MKMVPSDGNIFAYQVWPQVWKQRLLGFSACQAVWYLSHEDFSCFPTSVFRHSAPGSQKHHHGRSDVGNRVRGVGEGFQLSEVDLKKSTDPFKTRGGLENSCASPSRPSVASYLSFSHPSWFGSSWPPTQEFQEVQSSLGTFLLLCKEHCPFWLLSKMVHLVYQSCRALLTESGHFINV